LQENKISLALLWSKYSGDITSVNDLVMGLDKKRFNIIFIYLSGYGVEKNLIEEAGYKVCYLSRAKQTRNFNFSILLKLIQILKEHKIEIIHCHAHKPTVYGTIAATFAHTPVVMAHVHGLGRSRTFRRKLLNLLLFRRISTIIPVAESVKEDVLRNNWFLSPGKLSILENSIDYERFASVPVSKKEAKQMLQMPASAFVFGTIGRLAPTKGLPYLIEAFSRVKAQISSAHLILLGDGPLKPELEKQAGKIQCKDSIHFLGYRTNVESLLRGIDVFVLSSIAEGMPRAILEAMAAGVPCVATEVGGIPEIISDGDAGFLVPPGDSNAFAQTMLKVANMPRDELAALAERARNRVRTVYSHSVVREKLKDLYVAEYEASIANRGRC
jgi:glycosyltransferase involved in cell wall biosynthesis